VLQLLKYYNIETAVDEPSYIFEKLRKYHPQDVDLKLRNSEKIMWNCGNAVVPLAPH
jgi:hypothetical protein